MIGKRTRSLISACCFLTVLSLPALARAEPTAARAADEVPCERRSTCAHRSKGYVGAHAATVGGLLLAALISNNAIDPPPPAERAVAPSTLGLADGLLSLEIALPLPVLKVTMTNKELFDASLSYSQSLLLATTGNHLFRLGKLNSSSFVGFAAAVSSAYLLDQVRDEDTTTYSRFNVNPRIRGTFWGVQGGFAMANAVLSVKGGRTPWYAALFGAAGGIGAAVAVQAVHCESFHRRCYTPSFITADGADSRFVWAANGSLLAVGFLAPLIFAQPFYDDSNLHYQFEPTAFGPDSLGVQLRGLL